MRALQFGHENWEPKKDSSPVMAVPQRTQKKRREGIWTTRFFTR